jgi:hypothetical protein
LKLRCTSNSIRIRLRKSEVAQLAEQKSIQESMYFTADSSFVYSILADDSSQQLHARLDPNHIRVLIPQTVAMKWANSDQVSLSHTQELGNGLHLDLLIEKDYPCTTRPDEDKSDFYGDLQSKEGAAC